MKHILSLIIFGFTSALFAQQEHKALIALDPLVGTEINQEEKRKFVLFGFVDSLNYDFSQLFSLSDSTYLLEVHYTNGRRLDSTLSQSVIDYNKENIFYMEGYYKALEKQKEQDVLDTNDSVLVLSEPAIDPAYFPMVNKGALYVVKTESHKKIKIKKGKYYHFKIVKDPSKLNIEYNPRGSKEKHRNYQYAKVKYIIISDSTLCLRKRDAKLDTYVKFNEIIGLKQNTFESSFVKALGAPSGHGFFYNPFILLYTPPILAFNLIFKMKNFDLGTNSKFLFI